MKRLLLGLATIATLPVRSLSLWWSISNGLEGGFLPQHKHFLNAKLGNEVQIVALNKFDFGPTGRFDYELSVVLQAVTGLPGGGSLQAWIPYSHKPVLELLVCSSEAYLKLYDANRQMSYNLCTIAHQDLCEHAVLTLDLTRSAPTWSVNLSDARVTSKDTIYFLLSACGLSDIVDSTDAQIHANFNFFNGYQLLSTTEATLRDTYFVFANIFLGVAILWYLHCWWWHLKVDVTLQIALGVVVGLKSSIQGLLVYSLYFKGIDAHLGGCYALFYILLVVISIYVTVFMQGIFLLSKGFRILPGPVDRAHHIKMLRLVIVFGLFTGLFIFSGRSSIFLWIMLMFMYIMIVSAIFRAVADSLRVVTMQLIATKAQRNGALALEMHTQARQLGKRERFLEKSKTIFYVLKFCNLLYFCFLPLLLMVVQMLSLRSGESGAYSVLVPAAESADLVLFLVLGYAFRARSLEKYIAQSDQENENGDQSAAFAPESGAEVELQQTQRPNRTVVVPMSSDQALPNPVKEETPSPKTADRNVPVITVTNFGENEQDINVGIAQQYKTAGTIDLREN